MVSKLGFLVVAKMQLAPQMKPEQANCPKIRERTEFP
jgi:hypothetical protein